jgi:hypothetical protein
MTTSRCLTLCFVFALSALVGIAPAAAQTFFSGIEVSGPGCLTGDNDFTGALVSKSCELAIPSATASARASARASLGEMGVAVSAVTSGFILHSQAVARAEIGDQFFVTGLDGAGYLRFHFSIVGTGPLVEIVNDPADPHPVADLALMLHETGAMYPLAPGTQFINVPIVVGANPVTFSLLASARCRSVDGSCTAFADFLNTATIVGISVLDSSGAAAPAANWAAASGYSYSPAPVPPRYIAQIQRPIAVDASSSFNSTRGVIPVKFSLAVDNVPTCELPPATLGLYRTATSAAPTVNESEFILPPDSGPSFRIDADECQYVYNLRSSALGPGVYIVTIKVDGTEVGRGTFALK